MRYSSSQSTSNLGESRGESCVLVESSRKKEGKAGGKRPKTAPETSAGERGMAGDQYHIPIMAAEALELLSAGQGKNFHDGTLGGGGHTRTFLDAGAHVLAMDQDWAAIERAQESLMPTYGNRLRVWQGNFAQLEEMLAQNGVDQKFDAMFYDLGASSRQFEDAARGFSFQRTGPLDMRLNQQQHLTAALIVNTYPDNDLRRILWDFGEESQASRIVRAILKHREEKPLETTTELADLIASVIPKKGRTHPGTKTFQAIRVAVNDELGSLDAVLEQIPRLLKVGGRVGFLTFHSLEDRRVKQWMKRLSTPTIDRPEWSMPKLNPEYCFNLITRKAVTPSAEELLRNPRSRSCKLRVAELISDEQRLAATPRDPSSLIRHHG